MRLLARALMVLVGLTVLAFYAVVASAAYGLLLWAWSQRPDPVTTALLVLALTLAFGYASHELGTARMLRALGAVELPRARAPSVVERFESVRARMDVGEVDLLVANMPTPNALALGGGDGVVVVDAALVRLLDLDELEAILAHELAHLERRDGLVQTLGFSLVRTVMGLLALALLPFVLLLVGLDRAASWIRGRPLTSEGATAWLRAALAAGVSVLLVGFLLVLRAHSRRRELRADDRAAEVTASPLALASALARIDRATESERGTLSPLVIHGDEEGRLTRLLASHPPMDERIERLRERSGSRRIPIQ